MLSHSGNKTCFGKVNYQVDILALFIFPMYNYSKITSTSQSHFSQKIEYFTTHQATVISKFKVFHLIRNLLIDFKVGSVRWVTDRL